MLAVNVKTALPAPATLYGGELVIAHHVITSTGTIALGLMGIRQEFRKKRHDIQRAAAPSSFLLHTEAELRPRTLLDRTVRRIARIATG